MAKTLILLLYFASSVAISACQVPVFRYALERWEADNIKVLAETKDISFFKSQHSANITIVESDTDSETAVYLPGVPVPFFKGSLKEPSKLISSPLRNQIFKELTEGTSAVWILLKSGNQTLDAIAEKTLSQSLIEATQFYSTKREKDFESDELKAEIKTKIPLKIKFTYLSLDRDNNDEAFLTAMLLNLEPDLKDIDQPMAFAIYGRGRSLPPLIGKGISKNNIINEDCNYLCGDCTCEIKEQNPGTDLLFSQDWKEALQGKLLVQDKVLPALTGINLKPPVKEIIPEVKPVETISEEEKAPLNILYLLLLLPICLIIFWRFK